MNFLGSKSNTNKVKNVQTTKTTSSFASVLSKTLLKSANSQQKKLQSSQEQSSLIDSKTLNEYDALLIECQAFLDRADRICKIEKKETSIMKGLKNISGREKRRENKTFQLYETLQSSLNKIEADLLKMYNDSIRHKVLVSEWAKTTCIKLSSCVAYNRKCLSIARKELNEIISVHDVVDVEWEWVNDAMVFDEAVCAQRDLYNESIPWHMRQTHSHSEVETETKSDVDGDSGSGSPNTVTHKSKLSDEEVKVTLKTRHKKLKQAKKQLLHYYIQSKARCDAFEQMMHKCTSSLNVMNSRIKVEKSHNDQGEKEREGEREGENKQGHSHDHGGFVRAKGNGLAAAAAAAAAATTLKEGHAHVFDEGELDKDKNGVDDNNNSSGSHINGSKDDDDDDDDAAAYAIEEVEFLTEGDDNETQAQTHSDGIEKGKEKIDGSEGGGGGRGEGNKEINGSDRTNKVEEDDDNFDHSHCQGCEITHEHSSECIMKLAACQFQEEQSMRRLVSLKVMRLRMQEVEEAYEKNHWHEG